MYAGEAHAMYFQARNRGRWGRIWSVLTGHSRRLLSLSDLDAACTIRGRHHAGIRTVPIARIRGSEGRSHDFDCQFRPLKGHTRERWLRVATARVEGKALPPVELVQVGDAYFCRDGHHRISVARALGQTHVEAEVRVWQMSEPLPREMPAALPCPAA